MSHEIRTPMNAHHRHGGPCARHQAHARAARVRDDDRASRREALLDLINDILDFSKIEARKLALEQIPFALRDTVEDAMKSLAIRAQQRGARAGLPHPVATCPTAWSAIPAGCKQVLTNLVANAVKFTEQGEVVVTVDAASFDQNAVVLHFAVSDTGIGIPQEKRSADLRGVLAGRQLDDAEVRRDGPRTVDRQRSWCRSWAARCGSTARSGRAAPFTSPRASPVRRGCRRGACRRSLDLHDLRVLIVDDNATNRRILHEVLRELEDEARRRGERSRRPRGAQGGAQGGRPYALVIIDGQMPQMDGFMFASRVRRDRQLCATPLVMLTSAALPDDRRAVPQARDRRTPDEAGQAVGSARHDVSLFGGRGASAGHGAVDSLDRTAAKPLRVLVAEDNHVNRQFVTRVLEKRGHSVATAVNGRQAIDAIAAAPGHFDLVLMDVQMPEVDGLSATC